MMKIATWNVNSLNVRLAHVLSWLEANPIDILALQEIKMTEDKFPFEALASAGYHSICLGQKTYNGVALLSRTKPVDVVRNIPTFIDPSARVITATYAYQETPLRVIGAYFPNGQSLDSDKFVYKMDWLNSLETWLKEELERHPLLILMGDFNITFDDHDVWDPQGMHEQIHCSSMERTHLNKIVNLGLVDCARLTGPLEKNYSWWDYRQLAFRKNQGMRIDHILMSTALNPHFLRCIIDKAPRKLERPSDHTPVCLELN